MDYQFTAGRIPLLISMPHVGTDLPDQIAVRLTPAAASLADTDWHLARLYEFARELGASTLAARWSRYVIDLNRPPSDSPLYPGRDGTGLCPLDTFQRAALYLPGLAPTAAEVQQRLQAYWQPYHQQLQAELARLLALHERVVLWDAHSIASVLPRLFDGKLPDLNLGTADGASCAPGLGAVVQALAQGQSHYSVAVNGRFKGGHITRHYGRPGQRVHALQLELCQSTYMDEGAPFGYRDDLAPQLQVLLRQMTQAAADWAGA